MIVAVNEVRHECSATLSGSRTPAIHQPVRRVCLSVPASYRKRPTADRSSATTLSSHASARRIAYRMPSSSRRARAESSRPSNSTGSEARSSFPAGAPGRSKIRSGGEQSAQSVDVQVEEAVVRVMPRTRGTHQSVAGPRARSRGRDEIVGQLDVRRLAGPVRPVVGVRRLARVVVGEGCGDEVPHPVAVALSGGDGCDRTGVEPVRQPAVRGLGPLLVGQPVGGSKVSGASSYPARYRVWRGTPEHRGQRPGGQCPRRSPRPAGSFGSLAAVRCATTSRRRSHQWR